MKSLINLSSLSGLILLAPLSSYAQDAKGLDGLTLRGQVLSIELTRKDKNYVDAELKLSLDFVNESNEPIIILQPVGSEEDQRNIFWQADVALAKTKENAVKESF